MNEERPEDVNGEWSMVNEGNKSEIINPTSAIQSS
jgi:hypothetical protein